MKKIIIPFILILCLLLSLCACGKSGASSDSSSDTAEDAAAQAEQTAAEIETDLSAYEIYCVPLEGEMPDKTIYDGVPVAAEDQEYYTQETYVVTVEEKDGEKEVFSLLLNSYVGKEYIEENEAVPTLIAKSGDTWLFSVKTNIDEDTDYYLFDAESEAFTPLGLFGDVKYAQNMLFLRQFVYGDGYGVPLYVYDWSGKELAKFDGVFDAAPYNDTLYALTVTPLKLKSVALSELAKGTADVTLTDSGLYFGEFIAAFTGDEGTVTLTSADGETQTTCSIDELEATLNQLQPELSTDESDLNEACGLFNLNLPEFWRGKYTCYKDDTAITFYHKASADAGKSGLLFTIAVEEKMQADWAIGDGTYEVCRLIHDGEEKSVAVAPAMESKPYTKKTKKEYKKLLKLLDVIEKRIKPVSDGDSIKLFDYEKYVGKTYEGYAEEDVSYVLHILSADHSVLSGTLAWEAPQDREDYNVQITMFDNEGNVVWEAVNWEGYGGGTLRFDGDKTYFSFNRWQDDELFDTGEFEMTELAE